MQFRCIATLGLILLAEIGVPVAAVSGDLPNSALRGCIAGASPDQQRQCDQQVTDQVTNGSRIVPLESGWRLVRTKGSSGGPDAVSVIHVADSARSDLSLAGLSLQCGQQGVEVVVITLERMPRGDRRRVVFGTGNSHSEFDAIVVQAGEALLLPRPATDLAAAEWPNLSELSIEIKGSPATIRGVIPISGLTGATKALMANCPSR